VRYYVFQYHKGGLLGIKEVPKEVAVSHCLGIRTDRFVDPGWVPSAGSSIHRRRLEGRV